MSSLYKRANPSQAMILRIIEGAFKNTCDAHGVSFDPIFARSVAKRAAGTLSSQWPEVLAAMPSEKLGAATTVMAAQAASRNYLSASGAGSLVSSQKMGGAHPGRPLPLRSIFKKIQRLMWRVKRCDDSELMAGMVAILKELDEKGLIND